MNKNDFLKTLEERLNCKREDAVIINDILEANFFISKKNKDKIIEEIQNRLNVDAGKATEIYNISIDIINKEIAYKLKHPFESN